MERLCFKYGRQISRAGIICALGVSAALSVPSSMAQESMMQQEINRRQDNARKANGLLQSGDASYRKGDYKSAVTDYSQAFSLISPGAAYHTLRQAAAERYATAATERSRQLAKGGQYKEAKTLLNDVLKPTVAPSYLPAIKLLAQIDDPIRYNPALTRQHVTNAQRVGRLLREAEGFYSLGQYDRSLMVYQDVLRIDPFNKAARRGMEKVETVKSDYYRAASDHNRAKMLSEVDAAWELYVPPAVSTAHIPGMGADAEMLAPSLSDKLSGIIVETVNLDGASLDEAIDFVRHQSRIGDAVDARGEQSGVNFIINLGDETSKAAQAVSSARINLKLTKVPLSKLLDYITDQTGTKWKADGVGILITPRNSSDNSALVSRTFRVPHNFFISGKSKDAGNNDNPFGDNNDAQEGKIAARVSPTEFLKKSGVSFPDGAVASYSAASNTLYVHNTAANIDLVDQLVSLTANEEPVQVVIRTTIMRVSEEDLKELSFDWSISPYGLNRNTFLGGGTPGNGTAIGDIPSAPFTTLNGNSLTSGNRSGAGAIAPDSIDAFLNASQTGIASGSNRRAPGILTLHGVYSNLHIQMMMRGLAQKTSTDVMVRPSTVTRNGQRAKIEVIRSFIYPTEYEPPELPNSVGGGGLIDPVTGESASAPPPTPVTPAHPTAFGTRDVGVTLEVEPRVSADRNYIDLSISPEFVEFEGFVNYGSPINGVSGGSLDIDLGNLGGGNVFNTTGGTFGRITDNRILMPIFKTIRMKDSTLTIQDGHTLVMGGVMTSRKTKIQDKVPILGDIPLIGRTFRSEASHTYNEAVIIMVNAEIIDPGGKAWRNR
ncbi:MAG: Amuc_1098 family type IV pilus outer membrane protein [Akkermansiaceae bacterium]